MARSPFVAVLAAVLGLGGVLAAQSPGPLAIGGALTDENGRPIEGAEVCAMPWPRSRRSVTACARTRDGGRFVLRVPPGTYHVFGEYRLAHYHPPALPFFRHPSSPPLVVRVRAERPTTWVTVVLPPRNGLLSGQLVDAETGLAVDSVRFRMCHAADRQACWDTGLRSDTGEFTIPAPHVPFTLTISSEGYHDWRGMRGSDAVPLAVASGAMERLTVLLQPHHARRAPADAGTLASARLPAPELMAPFDGAELGVFPRDTVLEWKQVEGARKYRIDVDFCDGGQPRECLDPQPLVWTNGAEVSGTRYTFRFLGAQPGRWRVWAVDGSGRDGHKSEWRTFLYLR